MVKLGGRTLDVAREDELELEEDDEDEEEEDILEDDGLVRLWTNTT
jgi:hypothetical protein